VEFTYEPEDFCFALPVRARRALARERLSSYREPASRNPQAMHTATFRKPYARALFRLLPIRAPRQAVLRTSFWLAPSRRQQALRPPGGEDAQCVQPMSATQTNYVHPHLVCSQLAHATFAAGTPHGVLGSTRHDWGTGRFTTSEDRFGGSSSSTCSPSPFVSRLDEGAWAFSSHGADATEPLTPPSRPPLVHPHASHTFACAAIWPFDSAFGVVKRVGGCGDRQDHHPRRLVKADASR